MPHPPLSLIYCSLLPPCVPLPGKVYVVSRHFCHLCPPLGGGILGTVPPPPNTKHDALLSSLHPLSSLPELRLACHPPIAVVLFLFVIFVPTSPPVRWTGSDMVNIVIASRSSCCHHHPHPRCFLLVVFITRGLATANGVILVTADVVVAVIHSS